MSPYKREAGENVMKKARGWRDERKGSWTKECQGLLEARKYKDMDSPLKPLEGVQQPNLHLDFRLVTYRSLHKSICVKPGSFC